MHAAKNFGEIIGQTVAFIAAVVSRPIKVVFRMQLYLHLLLCSGAFIASIHGLRMTNLITSSQSKLA
jgi:hypothetical protein